MSGNVASPIGYRQLRSKVVRGASKLIEQLKSPLRIRPRLSKDPKQATVQSSSVEKGGLRPKAIKRLSKVPILIEERRPLPVRKSRATITTRSNARTVSPPTRSNARTVSPPTISNDRTVSSAAGSNDRTVSPTTISNDRTVSPTTISNDRTVSSANGSNDRTVSPTTVSNVRTVSPTTISNDRTVSPTTVSNDRAVSSATISNNRAVSSATTSNDRPNSSATNETVTPPYPEVIQVEESLVDMLEPTAPPRVSVEELLATAGYSRAEINELKMGRIFDRKGELELISMQQNLLSRVPLFSGRSSQRFDDWKRTLDSALADL